MGQATPEKLEALRKIAADGIELANPTHLIGLDEVGFGAIAGPLVIGAVGVPVGWKGLTGLTDSKELSGKQIAKLAGEFFALAAGSPEFVWALMWSSSKEIDENRLGACRRRSFVDGIQKVADQYPPTHRVLAIVDGNLNIPRSLSVPKADLILPVVSMASVIAKYARDEWMRKIAETYPGYGFEQHVGYDTELHRAALNKLGACEIHRQSTRTIRDLTPAVPPPPDSGPTIEEILGHLEE